MNCFEGSYNLPVERVKREQSNTKTRGWKGYREKVTWGGIQADLWVGGKE